MIRVCFLLVLVALGSSFAACGSSASFGFSPDNSPQVFNCDSEKCMVGIRGVEMFPHDYICDTEVEFIKDVKKRFGRDVPKGKYEPPFRYGNMARQYEPNMIQSGCDFLKVEPVYGIDSVTVALKPKKAGVCPVAVNVLTTGKNRWMFLAVISKVESRWSLTLEHNQNTDESNESEFTFFELPFSLFVKPCVENRCDFLYAERMPSHAEKMGAPQYGKKAVLLTNERRFKPMCDFVKVEKSNGKLVSGTFVLNGSGRCRIQIDERKFPIYNDLKVDLVEGKYQVVLE